ncbi:MAG: DMT family transporter [Candidatus Gottesmanbacteria bacterium]
MKLSKGFIYTFLSAFAWAISIIIVRMLLNAGINAYQVSFWTVIFAIPFWLLVLLNKSKELKNLSRNTVCILLCLGIIYAAINIVEIFALKYSQAMNFSFINRTVILFTIVLAWIFLGEKLTLKKNILALLIIIGSYLLITKAQSLSLTLGDSFTLLEAFLIGISNILAKVSVTRTSPLLTGSAVFLISVIPTGVVAHINNGITFPESSFLLMIIAFSYIVLNIFRYKALKLASASYVTMVFSFTPVLVALMAIPLLGESLIPIQILGGFLIILAGILVEKLKI